MQMEYRAAVSGRYPTQKKAVEDTGTRSMKGSLGGEGSERIFLTVKAEDERRILDARHSNGRVASWAVEKRPGVGRDVFDARVQRGDRDVLGDDGGPRRAMPKKKKAKCT